MADQRLKAQLQEDKGMAVHLLEVIDWAGANLKLLDDTQSDS